MYESLAVGMFGGFLGGLGFYALVQIAVIALGERRRAASTLFDRWMG